MAEGLTAGRGQVDIEPRTDGFERKLQRQVEPALTRVGKKLSSAGSALTKGVTLPLIAAGGAAFAAFDKVDGAVDSLRANTGKTGVALQGLRKDWEKVATTTPTGLQEAADVVGQLNQRLGATGPQLQTLSKQILEAGRITGQGALSVDAVTRVFGDWSVATEAQTGQLDKLFRASQASGVPIGDLMDKVVQFGAPLRAMGFNLDQSIALFAKFQKEGVNTETVLGGIRQFLVKAAKDGKDAPKLFAEVSKKIRELSAAGKEGEALALGRQFFGARTFLDATRAIIEGRFAFQDYVAAMADGKETILGVAEATKDAPEKAKEAFNRLTLAAAPLGEKLSEVGLKLIPIFEQKIIPFVEKMVDKFNSLSPDAQERWLKIAGGLVLLGPALKIVGGFLGPLGKFVGLMSKLKNIGTVKTGVDVATGGMGQAGSVAAGVQGVLGAAAAGAVIGTAIEQNFVRPTIKAIETANDAVARNADAMQSRFITAMKRMGASSAEISPVTRALNKLRTEGDLTDDVMFRVWENADLIGRAAAGGMNVAGAVRDIARGGTDAKTAVEKLRRELLDLDGQHVDIEFVFHETGKIPSEIRGVSRTKIDADPFEAGSARTGHTGGITQYLPRLHAGGMPPAASNETLALLRRDEFVVPPEGISIPVTLELDGKELVRRTVHLMPRELEAYRRARA